MSLWELLNETSRPMMAMPSPGAVWPAMVRLLATLTAELRWMVPPTSKTTVRLVWATASRKEPGPESLRLVTW